MQMKMDEELQRTQPDYVVYKPHSMDGSTYDTGNEHFLVFDGPDRSLMVVWTQSTREGQPDQRIVFSHSNDGGCAWSHPVAIAGPEPPSKGNMASWGFPMVSKTGRIYVLYNKHIGVNDIFLHTTGLMAGIYSDDSGKTWSQEQVIPMPRSKYDNPDPSVPANWIIWQKPLRLSEGKYLAGFTRWVSPAVRPPKPIDVWWAEESVVEFMRFENIDKDPAPEDINISYFAWNEEALRVGLIGYPGRSVVQEPSIVALPNGQLFCAMRTTTGNPYYTISADAGKTWGKPEPIKYTDNGAALLHPCSPCPIYDIGNGQYIFLFHNHDGHIENWGPRDTTNHRRPINVALGEYRQNAEQPVWFSKPKFLMDNKGIHLGYEDGRADLAMYASFTIHGENRVLWYPERKFFLLGKKITSGFLSDMRVPVACQIRHERNMRANQVRG
jgi:hypothetical protein